jgi:hypothetical protein
MRIIIVYLSFVADPTYPWQVLYDSSIRIGLVLDFLIKPNAGIVVVPSSLHFVFFHDAKKKKGSGRTKPARAARSAHVRIEEGSDVGQVLSVWGSASMLGQFMKSTDIALLEHDPQAIMAGPNGPSRKVEYKRGVRPTAFRFAKEPYRLQRILAEANGDAV